MNVSVSSLNITIQTGGDDLRGDSSATAFIVVTKPNGNQEYSTTLKSQTEGSWDNNSTHGPIAWNLPLGVTDDNISLFGIRMQSHESGFETSDNWDIASVLVTYPNATGGQNVLLSEAGGPLARLTGSNPQWETTVQRQ